MPPPEWPAVDEPPLPPPPSVWVQLVDLCLIELTNWRWSWRSLIVIGGVTPLLSMAALAVFARDDGPVALQYILTGNLVMALMFTTLNNVESHFVFMRFQGVLDYFATLPIRRTVLIVAVVSAFFWLALPALIVTAVAGAWMLDVPLRPHPLLLVVVPLCVLPMALVGALIGSLARTPQEGGSYSLLVMFVLLGLGPVVFPPARLPAISVVLGRFSPATYAADALRQTLIGPVTGALAWDLAALLLFTAATFWIVGRTLDWRGR